MAEYKRPTNEAEFNSNFAPIEPVMNRTEAYYESSRCLFCFDAPCVQACPTHIDIPLFIRQINTGNVIGAAETIYNSNYFGFSCGKVCPTEVLCEGACVYNLQNVKPIEIGRLQANACDEAMKKDVKLFKAERFNGKKIGIIGAGPAGISAACELRRMGYYVDVFEKTEKPSGLNIHGIAPYKITNTEALDEINYLQKQLGFEIFYNKDMNNEADLKFIDENYDAVFIGTGLGETTKLGIPGEDKDNVFGATEFIEILRKDHSNTKVGEIVVVLGGGNTSMDAASETARMGAKKVYLAYRRNKHSMPAYEFEYDLAKNVGVEGMFNIAPIEIVGNGKVTGVKFIRTEEESGSLKNIEGSEFVLDCDMVIKATGQSKMKEMLCKIKDIEVDEKGRLKVNKENYQTGNKKYFASGDVISGGQEVVNAVADAKKAAWGIHDYLKEHLNSVFKTM